jgi:glycerol transport system ATP-binding protein
MHEGRVTQFGPTADAYRRPGTLETARVFSDPPINIGDVVKKGGVLSLDGHATWPAAGAAAAMPDGSYRLAVRPHHIAPARTGDAAVPLEGSVLLTELSGSESVAHFRFGDRTWVSQSHGVHAYSLGEPHTFWLDPSGHLYFDGDGNLVAA